jgi:hypothetical protein
MTVIGAGEHLVSSGFECVQPMAALDPKQNGGARYANDLTRTVSAGDHLPPRGRGDSMAGGKWKIAAVAAALIVIASSTLWYFESPAWTLNRHEGRGAVARC